MAWSPDDDLLWHGLPTMTYRMQRSGDRGGTRVGDATHNKGFVRNVKSQRALLDKLAVAPARETDA